MSSNADETRAAQRPSWYQKDVNLEDISPEGQLLLQEYSGVKREDLLQHILRVV